MAVCEFCGRGDLDKATVGETRQLGDIVIHEYCVYFSSGLCQRGHVDEGMYGFLTEDIEKELKRGKKLRCSVCNQRGGYVGCVNPWCKKQGHFPCLREAGYTLQYYDLFQAYCPKHCPSQLPPTKVTMDTERCCICLSRVGAEVAAGSMLYCPACHKPLHRQCLQSQALASGRYYFKCPACNDKEAFIPEMLRMGINVPLRDAQWEEGSQFADIYEVFKTCTAEVCLCKRNRQYFASIGKNKMKKCVTCGQCLGHVQCLENQPSQCKDCEITPGRRVSERPTSSAVTPCTCTICIAKAAALSLTQETADAIRRTRKRSCHDATEDTSPASKARRLSSSPDAIYTPLGCVRLPPGIRSPSRSKPMIFREVFPLVKRAPMDGYRPVVEKAEPSTEQNLEMQTQLEPLGLEGETDGGGTATQRKIPNEENRCSGGQQKGTYRRHQSNRGRTDQPPEA